MKNALERNKMRDITVNGKKHTLAFSVANYNQICTLAYGRVIPELTCTYSRGGNNGGGFLSSGGTLEIGDGWHFDIVSTSNA